MRKARKLFLVTVACLVVVAVVAAVSGLARPGAKTFTIEPTAIAQTAAGFTYEHYARTLERFVDEAGMVDYRALKADSASLQSFLAAIANLEPAEFNAWDDAEKIAFWTNAYNALTLAAIAANYPIEPSLGASLIYPKNSIRQIPGVWDKLQFTVMGAPMTLDAIEHQRLRKLFNEPRVHMALVCAAHGCALLRREPYAGEKLDDQLDDQARRFLANPEKFRIDRGSNRVYLSPIFKWFGEDFVKSYAADEGFEGHGEAQRAVLSFISRHLSDADRDYLSSGNYTVKFLGYDWSLNEQTGG